MVSHESPNSFKTEEGNILRVDESEEVIWCREESALDPSKPNITTLPNARLRPGIQRPFQGVNDGSDIVDCSGQGES